MSLSAAAVATIAELWRYPVKGMRGERIASLALDAWGVADDRRFAIRSSGAPLGKPMLRGAERAAMLLFAASMEGEQVTVTTPGGERFPVGAPGLLDAMQAVLPGGYGLSLVRSVTPMNDVRPVALLGLGTVGQLGEEMGAAVDARRFRSNILLAIDDPAGSAEDRLVGCTLRLGDVAEVRVTERTPRCRRVTLDPDTAMADPALMKHLDRRHDGCVGIYASVVRTGVVRVGDCVWCDGL